MPESQWSGLRSSIDLSKRLEPPAMQILSEGPRIALVEDIASPEMCDWLIARARPRLKPAKILDRATGESSISGARTRRSCYFRLSDSDLIFAVLRARIAKVTEMQDDALEIPYVLHYLVGHEFRPISTSLSSSGM